MYMLNNVSVPIYMLIACYHGSTVRYNNYILLCDIVPVSIVMAEHGLLSQFEGSGR